MARTTRQGNGGFAFTYTDINTYVFPPKDGVHDTIAWADLDGDGCIDMIGISTASGNYEDNDHELVGLHVPTGNVVWRALRGEVSKKLSLVDGVVVASTNTAGSLRGIDPRSGAELWRKNLDDKMKEDPVDGDDRAPAIVPMGAYFAIECVDETTHIFEAKSGRLVRTIQGELRPQAWNIPGLAAFKTENHEGNDVLELWDIARGRSVYQCDESQVRTIYGATNFCIMHRSEGAPGGGYAIKVVVFDTASLQQVGVAWLDAPEGMELRQGASEYGITGGFLLAENRVAFGYRYDEGASYLAQLVPNKKTMVMAWPPPKPGYNFRALAWCAPVIVSVWQKSKGTEKLAVMGHDPNTMAGLWVADDLGGRHLDNVLHVCAGAVLVPKTNDNYYDQQNNPCAMVQLDPNNGSIVTQYPLENVDTVHIAGNFLCGAPDYFSGGTPTAYDITKRERVL